MNDYIKPPYICQDEPKPGIVSSHKYLPLSVPIALFSVFFSVDS